MSVTTYDFRPQTILDNHASSCRPCKAGDMCQEGRALKTKAERRTVDETTIEALNEHIKDCPRHAHQKCDPYAPFYCSDGQRLCKQIANLQDRR